MNASEVKAALEAHSYQYETEPILRDERNRPLRDEENGGYKRGPKETRTHEIEDIGEWMDSFGLDDNWRNVPGLGQVETVESHGGEGQGDSAWFVLKVTPEGGSDVRYFRMDGSYQSYDGFYWDGPFVEVTPTEKLVTVYEEVR